LARAQNGTREINAMQKEPENICPNRMERAAKRAGTMRRELKMFHFAGRI